MALEPKPVSDTRAARVLVKLGDLVTTDHISPAGAIASGTPAWDYLAVRGVERRDVNTYASRRGNHEVMMRGAFANVRLQNRVAPGTRGGRTLNFLDGGSETTVYEAAAAYREARVPMVVVAGRDYGGGSSRDWAAKGPALLGVRAVIAQSFERIRRSNLVAMGVIPIEVTAGPDEVAPTGTEDITISGLDLLNSGAVPAEVVIHSGSNRLTGRLRLDTEREADYIRHGGVVPYVLRRLYGGAGSQQTQYLVRTPGVLCIIRRHRRRVLCRLDRRTAERSPPGSLLGDTRPRAKRLLISIKPRPAFSPPTERHGLPSPSTSS
ncbi:Aconitate hydratase [Mycolicibacterium rhodesiae JS60]|nr:Aconitate hydratase [Mycolicibacterium rhodesiae JS60]